MHGAAERLGTAFDVDNNDLRFAADLRVTMRRAQRHQQPTAHDDPGREVDLL